jgi:hypothetical protein
MERCSVGARRLDSVCRLLHELIMPWPFVVSERTGRLLASGLSIVYMWNDAELLE